MCFLWVSLIGGFLQYFWSDLCLSPSAFPVNPLPYALGLGSLIVRCGTSLGVKLSKRQSLTWIVWVEGCFLSHSEVDIFVSCSLPPLEFIYLCPRCWVLDLLCSILQIKHLLSRRQEHWKYWCLCCISHALLPRPPPAAVPSAISCLALGLNCRIILSVGANWSLRVGMNSLVPLGV